jgi:hypothetical protein
MKAGRTRLAHIARIRPAPVCRKPRAGQPVARTVHPVLQRLRPKIPGIGRQAGAIESGRVAISSTRRTVLVSGGRGNRVQAVPFAFTLTALSLLLVLGADSLIAGTCQQLDPTRSQVRIRVGRAGLFSAFAHDHEIDAPVAEALVAGNGQPVIAVRFATKALRVLDPGAPLQERAEIEKTMLGPRVLDAARFPEIRFRSQQVRQLSPERWQVDGELSLHGVTRSVSFTLAQKGDAYRATVPVRQSAFGIRPLRLAGGTVRVRDEVVVELALHLVSAPEHLCAKLTEASRAGS